MHPLRPPEMCYRVSILIVGECPPMQRDRSSPGGCGGRTPAEITLMSWRWAVPRRTLLAAAAPARSIVCFTYFRREQLRNSWGRCRHAGHQCVALTAGGGLPFGEIPGGAQHLCDHLIELGAAGPRRIVGSLWPARSAASRPTARTSVRPAARTGSSGRRRIISRRSRWATRRPAR